MNKALDLAWYSMGAIAAVWPWLHWTAEVTGGVLRVTMSRRSSRGPRLFFRQERPLKMIEAEAPGMLHAALSACANGLLDNELAERRAL